MLLTFNVQQDFFQYSQIVRVLEQADLTYVASPSVPISDEISEEGKSITRSVRPLSPYRARISVNGKLPSDTVTIDTKTSTGKI